MKNKTPVAFFLVLIMVWGGIFLFSSLVWSENTDIVINEICPTGCASKDHQWIEIYNKGQEAVDLEGWKFWEEDTKHGLSLASSSTQQDFLIEPGEYVIIAQNDYYFLQDNPDVTSTVFDSSWGTLNKSGELIGLQDSEGNSLEEFTYSAIENYSLERKDNEVLVTEENNWQEHPDSHTAGQRNYWSGQEDTSGEDEDDGTGEDDETPTSTPVVAANLVINEFASDVVAEENEWIELYNISTSSLDLSGWTLSDGVGEIAAPTGTIVAQGYFVVELSGSKLNNGGDIIILKNILGEIVDQVTYGSWDDGNTSDNAPVVADPNILARYLDGQDTDNDSQDFSETTTATKGASNIITSPVEDEEATPPAGGGGGGSSAPAISYKPGELVINELVSDPSDDGEEFVEFFNNTSQSIDLNGWWLEEGSESKTNLSGIISPSGFAVVEKPKGNLNNSGDRVILFAPKGNEIDAVTYGSWDDGNTSDNATTPQDPLSLARKVDGQDGDNDYYDFVLTSTVTKGETNVISSFVETGEVIEQVIGQADIIINEVLPNPAGSDEDDEFVEIKNLGTESIDLQGYKLGDATSRRYTISQGLLKPKGYIIFQRSLTGIAFNNSGGDEVKLYTPNDSLLDSVKYTGSAKEDESYARREDNSWAWTTELTPGEINIIAGQSAAPAVVIDTDTEVAVGEPVIFDASDTTDPDGDEMQFAWNFDDGSEAEGVVVEHTYKTEGVYTVELVVSDGSQESKKQVIMMVKNIYDFIGGVSDTGITKLRISEFVPNPEGSDTVEFIELFNPTDEEVDLSGLKLDDEEGGSRAYTVPDNTVILPQEYKVFGRQDTKLALNNTNDAVRLLYPDGVIITEVYYDDVQEGAAYIQNEDRQWVWTGSPTPGQANIIAPPKAVSGTKIVRKSNLVKPVIETTLEKLRDEDVGDMVKVTGVVAVEPGVLATQYFYIVGSPGVQVYMYKKDFPDLAVGDRVEITGEISEAYNNTRVKLTDKSSIKKIDHPGDPEPRLAEVAEIGEPLEGWLVEVNGEITELKSSYMYVDDGTEEVKVYFKKGAGINKKVLQVGDLVAVVGLVAQTKSGYQLLPRTQSDIEKTGVAEEFVTKIEASKEASAKEIAEKYLTATAGGLTAILLGLFSQSRGHNLLRRLKKIFGLVRARVRDKHNDS